MKRQWVMTVHNTQMLVNPQGGPNGIYRKIHMCDALTLGYNESVGIKPGNISVVADHEIGKLGMSICYGLRFPELYGNLAERVAEVVFVPSAFFLYTGNTLGCLY